MAAGDEEHRNAVTSSGRHGEDVDDDGGMVNLRCQTGLSKGRRRRRVVRSSRPLLAIATGIAAFFPTLPFPLPASLLCPAGVDFCAYPAAVSAATAAADDDHGEPSSSPPSYDWETWNYYQILGLEDPPPPHVDDDHAPTQAPSVDTKEIQRRRRSVTTSDVRKSYRRMAQRYHPDKIQQKQKQAQQQRADNGTVDNADEVSCTAAVSSGEGGGGKNETCSMSMEEANARFARISEAYQVLSDENGEREFYDEELGRWEDQRQWEERNRQQEHEMKGRQRQQHGGSGGDGEFFFTDPMTVFEQFFSGGGGGGSGGYYEDLFGNGRAESRHYGGGGPSHSPPRHVSERTEVLRGVGYDPRLGGSVDVHRVYRREEWPPDDGVGGGYFRIVAQDFFLEGGYYPGDLRYVPISDPTVVEEGYVEGSYGTGTGGGRRSEHATTRESPKDRLTEDEFMAPGSQPLRSANGRYAAYLTPHCELVIVRAEEGGGARQTIWGSDTFYPSGRCFLSLYGPRIGIFAGDHPEAQGLIWVSPMGDDEYDLEETLMPGDEGGKYSSYYLALDNDGSLAVYRMDGAGGVKGRGHEDQCVYATGVAGCMTGGRRIVAAGADVGRRLRRSWERMGLVARNFADALSEDEEEDEDAFDAVVRVLGIVARNLVRVGAEAGRWGMSLARRGFREGKTVTKLLGRRISETMRKWAKAKR